MDLKPATTEKGFSLLEIILVVLILSVIATLSLPQFSSMLSSLKFKQTVDDIAFLMRYAQSRAAVDGNVVRLEFSPDYKQYWLSKQSEDAKFTDPQFEDLSGRFGGVRNISPDVSLTIKTLYVQFYADGRIDPVDIDICSELRKSQKEDQATQKCLTITTRLKRGSVDIVSP